VTNGGYMLKRGDTYDIECARTSYRLRVGQGILKAAGLTQTWHHSDNQHVEFGRAKHACDYKCRCEWDAWATDEMFDRAYALADDVQTERGRYHQAQINQERMERERAKREAAA